MIFKSLAPFIPSGKDLEGAKQLFQELGFDKTWDQGDYAGFNKGECSFILQKYDNKEFAENLMLNVRVEDIDGFLAMVTEKKLTERFAIRISPIINQPYGREVNLIDLAGVCWHFVG